METHFTVSAVLRANGAKYFTVTLTTEEGAEEWMTEHEERNTGEYAYRMFKWEPILHPSRSGWAMTKAIYKVDGRRVVARKWAEEITTKEIGA